MKKQKININGLVKIKVVQLVAPSDNLRESYLIKSKDTLKSTKILLDNKQYSDSLAFSYFSMYNSVLALLFRIGIKSENHNASIFLLQKIFDIENEQVLRAKIERKEQQYYSNFSVNENKVKNAIKSTEDFNLKIKSFIDKLSLSDIENYRNKFKLLIKI